jgi:hypothetical protein
MYANTKRNAHQEEYFALDDAELRHVISILKLLALGAHKVCRALHVSSFAYDSLSHLFQKISPSFSSSFLSFWLHVAGWGASLEIFGPSTSPANFVQFDTHGALTRAVNV